MKNRMTLLVMLAISVSVFAQKKELKIAGKSLKKQDFAAALEQLKAVEPLLADADDKLKEKYYYIKAASTLGTNSENDEAAGLAFKELISFDKETGQSKYLKKAEDAVAVLVEKYAASGTEKYGEKDYKTASRDFEFVYTLSPKDTSLLDNAALSAYLDKDYDRSIGLYNALLDLGYTGISTQYKAKSVTNGEVIYFANEKDMNNQVNLKLAQDPEVVQTKSKTGDIARNIALSYIAKGDDQGALDAIDKAKKASPNDYHLVISEANIHYKLGNKEKFLEGLKKAISIKPNDPMLYYNVGVVTAEEGYIEESIKSYEKAIELNPEFVDAYINLGSVMLKENEAIVEEMNKSFSNFKKYDALQLEQKEVFKKALPYFEKAAELDAKNIAALETLVELYERLEMYDKKDAVKAQLEQL